MSKKLLPFFSVLALAAIFFSCAARVPQRDNEEVHDFLLERRDDHFQQDSTWMEIEMPHVRKDFHFPTIVRIGIEIEVSEIIMTAPGRITLRSTNAASGDRPIEVGEGTRIVFTSGAGERVVVRAGSEIGVFLNGVRIITETPYTPKYKNHIYRGFFEVVNYNSLLTLVNVIDVDEYLKGVVPSEIGRLSFREFEALKAQAVASRTYTFATLGKHQNKPFDLKASILDQVYKGIATANDATDAAVDSTRGIIMMQNGKPINAFFHSTCGGQTAGVEHVWGGSTPFGYLRSIRDTINGLDACAISPRYRWTRRLSWQQAERMLSTFFKRRDFRLNDIVIESRNASGRIERLSIRHNQSEVSVLGRDRIRWAFRDDAILSSSAFELEVVSGSHIVFSGRGFGHGVGMCQFGAINRARLGQSMEEILKKYYQNISFYNVRQRQ